MLYLASSLPPNIVLAKFSILNNIVFENNFSLFDFPFKVGVLMLPALAGVGVLMLPVVGLTPLAIVVWVSWVVIVADGCSNILKF